MRRGGCSSIGLTTSHSMTAFNRKVLDSMLSWIEPSDEIHQAVLAASIRRNKKEAPEKVKTTPMKRLR